MWQTAKSLLNSKKAVMAFVSAAVWLGGKVGLDLDAETLLPAVAPLWTYILSQGLSDFRKSATEIDKGSSAAKSAEDLT